MSIKCNDCIKCASRDVFNGYCEARGVTVLIDAPANDCSTFAPARKCKFCASYLASAKDAHLGTCENVTVYPDLGACEKFARLAY